MSSMCCSRNDIVLLPIPFTDLNSSKVRPAIVVGFGSFSGDLFVVPITSQAFNWDDELSDSSGTQGQEALEGAQVLDAKDLTDIPFHIGGDIVLEPIRSRDGAIMDGRKEASLEENIDRDRGAACGLEFRHRKRQQREQTGSAGEALGDGSHPFELPGAGQKKSARPRIRIDGSLEVGEQRWAALDFVEDGLGAELAQKAAGVLGGEGACVGIFQGKVGGVGGGRPGQGGLARLTGTGDDHDGIGRQSPLKQWRDETRNRMGWQRRNQSD